ncbi:MAG TPA: 50S ribosomal protein L4, partial [Deltaproteobacteria bacterium]|nr:50S ribosomal protein L4 [Deltaproteobacteria bacterium]
MSTLALYSHAGKKVRDLDVDAALLAGPIRKALLYYSVRRQLAGRRAGTHATKTRAMVAGSTKKIYRQKGTGNARHGDIKALSVGGGRIFGPHPRDYSYTMPKTAKRRALQTVLALKNKEGALRIVENLTWREIKTKQAAEFFKALECKSALLVIAGENAVIEKSVRNLKGFKVIRAEGFNVYDALKYEHLLLTEEALQAVAKRIQPIPEMTK